MTTFEKIEFYINNRKVGPTGIIGAQPDLSFFEQIVPPVRGQCTITFQIGQQSVENRAAINETEYRVENNFDAFDIESFVETEKRRVRCERERASFTDELIDVYFISAQELLSWKQRFPAFGRPMLVTDPGPEIFCFTSLPRFSSP